MTKTPTIVTLRAIDFTITTTAATRSKPPTSHAISLTTPSPTTPTRLISSSPTKPNHIHRLLPPIITGIHRKLYPLSISKEPKTLCLDLRLVNKEIIAAIIFGINEPETLLSIEPLNGAFISLVFCHAVDRLLGSAWCV
ncbi:hypothetical protein Hanom_Chr02g00132361 [Helianthus anomalus]